MKVSLIGKRRRAEFARDIHHRSLPGTGEEGAEKYRCTGDNPFQQQPLLLAKAQLLNREYPTTDANQVQNLELPQVCGLQLFS
mgnify:FL=1